MNESSKRVEELAAQLIRRNWFCVTAESCTGGGISQRLTALAGSSAWFERGFVTYSNEAKISMLGVSEATISRFGAVSRETAAEMARGALRFSNGQMSVAVTGIAGPDGGDPQKPVGTVWFGWAVQSLTADTEMRVFAGNRESVRSQAVDCAIEGMLDRLRRLEERR